jgi:hypothetical protein
MDKEKQAVNVNQNELIDSVIEKVKGNNNKYYFYCPPMNNPSGGIGVLLRLAKVMKESDYDVKVIYEPVQDQRASYEASVKANKQINIYNTFKPEWMEYSVEELDFVPLGDQEITFNNGEKVKCSPLSLNPEDFVFIPEGYPNVMKKTMQVACKRIVIAQSWFYILNALNTGETWQSFGIKDVISISDAITEYLSTVMPGLSVKKLSQGINRDIFKVPSKRSNKYPMVGFVGTRGAENRLKTFNIIKTFQAFYPHLRWVRFVELNGLKREEFAERLQNCAFVLYTDDIAGFGTLPLEAMASGTHVVGWNSYGGKEYVTKDNGFWTVNGDIFSTAELLGVAIDKWLNSEMDVPEIQETYENTLKPYTNEKEKENFLKIINEYKNERIYELERFKKQ